MKGRMCWLRKSLISNLRVPRWLKSVSLEQNRRCFLATSAAFQQQHSLFSETINTALMHTAATNHCTCPPPKKTLTHSKSCTLNSLTELLLRVAFKKSFLIPMTIKLELFLELRPPSYFLCSVRALWGIKTASENKIRIMDQLANGAVPRTETHHSRSVLSNTNRAPDLTADLHLPQHSRLLLAYICTNLCCDSLDAQRMKIPGLKQVWWLYLALVFECQDEM